MKPAGPVEIWRIDHVSKLGPWTMTIRALAARTRKRRPETRVDVTVTKIGTFRVSQPSERTVDVNKSVTNSATLAGVVPKGAPEVDRLLRDAIAQLDRV